MEKTRQKKTPVATGRVCNFVRSHSMSVPASEEVRGDEQVSVTFEHR